MIEREDDQIMDWVAIAQYNIDSHLGDIADSETDPEEVLVEVETLAMDALIDNGCPKDLLQVVVNKVAEPYRVAP